jgi:hypothetical protein
LILGLHTSAFDHAAVVILLKKFLRLVARRGGSDDKGEAKSGDKVNLVNKGGDKENLAVALHKIILFQLTNISAYVPGSLAQLVGTISFYMQEPGIDP